MFDRIKNALEDARRTVAEAEKPTNNNENEVVPAWALIHIGDADDLEENVAAHEAACRVKGFRCVVISNHFPQSVLGKETVIFEFAPIAATSSHDLGPQGANQYLFDRLEHIVSFWAVVKCTWSGSYAIEVADLSEQFAPKHSILVVGERPK